MFWRSACFNLTGCHFQKNNTFLLMIHICPNLHNYPIKMPSRTLYAQPPEVCLGLSVFFGCTLSPSPTIACLRKKNPPKPLKLIVCIFEECGIWRRSWLRDRWFSEVFYWLGAWVEYVAFSDCARTWLYTVEDSLGKHSLNRSPDLASPPSYCQVCFDSEGACHGVSWRLPEVV